MTLSNTTVPLLPTIAPPPSAAVAISQSLSTIGLGYAIAIALGFLVLLSTLLLSSYLCCRHHRHYHHRTIATRSSTSVILPRVFFVSESDDEENPSNSPGVVGLQQSAINSYPKYSFSIKLGDSKTDSSSSICSICLSDYIEGEPMRMMPDCKHFFHLLCLDAWLKLNASCPVCRSSPLPTPLSTPLAEVVPLAQFADDRRRRS